MAKTPRTKKQTFPQKCRCGYRLDHPMVQPRLRFSAPKWVLLCLGATPYPSRVDYYCSRCDVVLDSTDKKEVLETF